MQPTANQNVKSSELSIVIHRADGTVEDLGVVSYWHKNPILRAIGILKVLWRARRRKS